MLPVYVRETVSWSRHLTRHHSRAPPVLTEAPCKNAPGIQFGIHLVIRGHEFMIGHELSCNIKTYETGEKR